MFFYKKFYINKNKNKKLLFLQYRRLQYNFIIIILNKIKISFTKQTLMWILFYYSKIFNSVYKKIFTNLVKIKL